MCRLALFHHSVDDALDRRFKEIRNIRSTEASSGITDTRHEEDTPLQLQLSEPNSMSLVGVSGKSKLYVLRCIDVPEAELDVLSKHPMIWSESSMNGSVREEF